MGRELPILLPPLLLLLLLSLLLLLRLLPVLRVEEPIRLVLLPWWRRSLLLLLSLRSLRSLRSLPGGGGGERDDPREWERPLSTSLIRLPVDDAVRSCLVIVAAAISSSGGSAGRCPREVEEGRVGSIRTAPGPGEMLCKESELPSFSGSIFFFS